MNALAKSLVENDAPLSSLIRRVAMPKSLTKKQNAVRAFRGALRGALHPPLDGYGSSCNAAESVCSSAGMGPFHSVTD